MGRGEWGGDWGDWPGIGRLGSGQIRDMIENIFTNPAILFIIIAAALAKNWDVFYGNLPALGEALVLLNVIMLALGLMTAYVAKLGPADATTISIESGVQNGTLGIAIGSLLVLNATEALPPTTVPAAVYSIIMYAVSLPFVFWRRKRAASH